MAWKEIVGRSLSLKTQDKTYCKFFIDNRLATPKLEFRIPRIDIEAITFRTLE